MLPTMIQDIDDVPLSSFSSFSLTPACAGRCLSTSYLSAPIAAWLSFVRLSSASRQAIVLHVVIMRRITRVSMASCRHSYAMMR